MKVALTNKSKTQVIISVDNIEWGVLPLANLPFFIDTSVDEQSVNDADWGLLRDEIRKYAWNRLLGYLARRERSMRESSEFLDKLPAHFTIRNDLLERAVERKFISDSRFAELYTLSLMRKQKSREEAHYKLREKGIDEMLIEKTLAERYTGEAETEMIERAVEKALFRFRDFPPRKRYEKALTSLCRSGFSYEDVKDMVRDAVYGGDGE